MATRSRAFLALAGALAALAVPAAAQAAERFYGITLSNRIVTFNSDSPGATRSSHPITGLLEDENIQGLDVRPATGRLYGVGTASRLYTIDPRTGRATGITPTLFEVFVRGRSIGFDFDPVSDTARLVTEDDQNIRIDPDSGQVVDAQPGQSDVQPDQDLSYVQGDTAAGPGDNPSITALAYSNNKAGATSTQLYGLDTVTNDLATSRSPNTGSFRTIGPLGLDMVDPNGFDIAGDGQAYAAFKLATKPDTGLYRISLASGRAFRVGRRYVIGTYVGRRRDPLRTLTAGGPVANDTRRPTVRARRAGKTGVPALARGRSLPLTVRCSEACQISGRLLLGKRTVGRGSGAVHGQAGKTVVRLRLTKAGRKLVKRRQPSKLRIKVAARDAAGNRARFR
jgi:Domain of unknown function (DUF4394)